MTLVFALVASALLPASALAWNDTCNAGELCVWQNGPFVVPLAAQGGTSDPNYTNDDYPNTTTTLNDTISSVRNNLGSNRVVWYFDIKQKGNNLCVPPGHEAGVLNSHNDQYSSHLISPDAC